MKKTMKYLSLVMMMFSLILITSCTQRPSNVVVNSAPAQELATLDGVNFDLQALGELAGKYPNPVELEKIINKQGGINNLDLDKNGEVDFISVVQYGDATYVGLQFKAQLIDGESEICTIEYDKHNKQMAIAGNSNYYPQDAYYARPFNPIGFYLFMGYPMYRSPYHYGHYGGFYSSYRSVGYSSYSNRSIVSSSRTSTTYTKTTRPTTKSKVTKPAITNKSKTATANAQKRKETLKKQSTKNGQKSGQAKTTQKQFKERDTKKPVNASGFADKTKSKTTTPTKTTTTPTKTVATPTARKSTPTSTKSSSSRSSSRSSSSSSSSRSSGRRSDMTFKLNPVAYNNALNKINKIDVFTYNYNTDMDSTLPSAQQIGCSAQQLSGIIPQVVGHDDKGLLVDYEMIVPVLLSAIKEQQVQINELKIQINELK